MLNEIKSIHDVLIQNGVRLRSNDSVLRNVSPSGKMFKIILSEKGDMKAVAMDAESRSNLKHVYMSSQRQFVITKLKPNLENNLEEITVKELNKMTSQLAGKLSDAKDFFKDLPRNKNTEALFVFLERYDSFENKADFLLSILKAIEIVDADVLSNDFYIAFEIDDYYELGCTPLNHQNMFEEWENYIDIAKNERYQEEAKSNLLDIFGKPYILNSESIGRAVFGEFTMQYFAKNIQVPSNFTYGASGLKSCPLSEQSKSEIHNTLSYLLDKSMKGKYYFSYNALKSKKSKQPPQKPRTLVIVVASPDKKVQEGLATLINLFNIGDSGADINILQESSQFIQKLKGEFSPKLTSKPIVLALAVPGNGPVNLLYSNEMDKDYLIQMSDEWVEGWKNYDSVTIKLMQKKQIKFRKTENSMTLNKFLQTINKKWNTRGDGDYFCFMNPEDGYKFFFSSENQLQKCVNIIATNHINLLIDMTDRIHNANSYDLDHLRLDIFSIPVMISILLSKMGISKEVYTKRPAFLLGKMMSHLDKFHRDCLTSSKNKTQIASKLVGSANIRLLLGRPSLALARTLQKAIHLLQKAKTVRFKEYKIDGKSSSYYDYHTICQISDELSKFEAPSQWSNLDKILIAYGYFLNK